MVTELSPYSIPTGRPVMTSECPYEGVLASFVDGNLTAD
jgi:hypothetical protein